MSKGANDNSAFGVAIPIRTSNMYALSLKGFSKVLVNLILEQRKAYAKASPGPSGVDLYIKDFCSLNSKVF